MKFNLSGYNIENLLKTLYLKKIKLYNVERLSVNQVSFEIEDKDKLKVKRQIANFKVTQTLTGIKKLPKFLLANLGVILGVFVGCIFSIFASAFTWQIIVYGTKDLQVSDIASVLTQNNISIGKINTQTSQEIERVLLNNYDRIAQVSVIRKGTAIIINLSEKLVYSEELFEPIKAKFSGIIEKINIITGTNNVKVGDYVNVGDVLVLPFNINANGEKVSVKPLAEIYGTVYIISTSEISKNEKVLKRTGKTTKEYSYKLFNWNIFSGKNKNSFALFETKVYNENVSKLVPFSRDVKTYYELELFDVEHNFESERPALEEKSKLQAYLNIPDGKILDEKTEVTIAGNKMFACTTLTLYGRLND